MGRDRHQLGQIGLKRLAPVSPDPDLRPEQRLGRRGPEADERFRGDDLELGSEPGQAGLDLPPIRLLMDTPLAPRFVPEVFDRVGDVGLAGGDASPLEPFGQDAPGRTHERVTLAVLPVARLFSHQHQACPVRALSHHGLGGRFVEVTGTAPLDRVLEAGQGGPVRDGRGRIFAHSQAHIPWP